METTRNRTATLRKVLMVVYVGVMLNLQALNAKAQNFLPATNLQSKHPVVESQRSLVRKIYTSQIGVREKQPNSGEEVVTYLRYVNLGKGNPWCAAFVCWVLGEAGVANPRTGWSPALFGERYLIWGKGGERGKVKACLAGRQGEIMGILNQRDVLASAAWQSISGLPTIYLRGQTSDFRLLTSSLHPQATDIFGLFFPEKGRIAHVGFVDEWQDPWVTTVEGNTNVIGSREGDGVYRKRRLVRSIYKVARYVE